MSLGFGWGGAGGLRELGGRGEGSPFELGAETRSKKGTGVDQQDGRCWDSRRDLLDDKAPFSTPVSFVETTTHGRSRRHGAQRGFRPARAWSNPRKEEVGAPPNSRPPFGGRSDTIGNWGPVDRGACPPRNIDDAGGGALVEAESSSTAGF